VGGCNYKGRSEYVQKANAGQRKWNVVKGQINMRRVPSSHQDHTLNFSATRLCLDHPSIIVELKKDLLKMMRNEQRTGSTGNKANTLLKWHGNKPAETKDST
jgi:hypothetical protein